MSRNLAPWLYILVFPLGLEGALLAIAWASQLAVRRQMVFSLELLTRTDPRPPILFLRAFADDQVPLREPKLSVIGRFFDVGQWRNKLDGMLLEEGTPYGPVVALGNPTDEHPPYGAARGYFDDKTWHGSVADLSQRSRAIVLCLDDTEGIWWEIELLQARAHLPKTLFLLHPKYVSAQANQAIMDKLAHAIGLAGLAAGPATSSVGTDACTIGLFTDAAGNIRILRSSVFSRFSYLFAIRAFLREKLGAEGNA